MGRCLRTTVPVIPGLLDPLLPDGTSIRALERERICADVSHFNKRHRVHDLGKLLPGDQVWVTDQNVSGTVLGNHPTPRSYRVYVPNATIRRNRYFLLPMDNEMEGCDSQTGSQVTENIAEPQTALAPQASSCSSKEPISRTRSGFTTFVTCDQGYARKVICICYTGYCSCVKCILVMFDVSRRSPFCFTVYTLLEGGDVVLST